MPEKLTLAIVVPAYNEALTIEKTIAEYQLAFPDAKVVVVDNNSSDETAALSASILRPNFDLLLQENKRGKSNAVARALARIDADIFLLTDADFTYPANDARKTDEILCRKPNGYGGWRQTNRRSIYFPES